jgi:O-antigen ligase
MSAPGNIPSLNRDTLITVIFALFSIAVISVNFSVAVSSIAMGTAILVWVILLIIRGRTEFPETQLTIFFLLYLCAEILSTIFSGEPSASLVNMKRLFQISIFYFALISITNEKRLRLLIASLIVVGATVSLFEAFSLTSVGGKLMRVSLFQYFLTEGGIKMLSLLLVLPFIIHPATPKNWRIGAILCSLPLLTGLILTQTRSSWLAFLSGVVVVAVMKNWKLIIVLVVLVVLFFLFAPADLRERAESIVNPTMHSNLTRIHMITTGWKMFLDRPVFGFGDVDLKKYYVTYIVPIDDAEGGHLHNNFMTLLVTLGGFGCLIVMSLFIKILLMELKAVRLTSSHWLYGNIAMGCFAAYVGFHVNGLFEWNFGDHEIAVLLWFSVGTALVSQRLYESVTVGDNNAA